MFSYGSNFSPDETNNNNNSLHSTPKLEIVDISPLAACTRGGRRVLVVVGEGVDPGLVEPVFRVLHRPHLDQVLCQVTQVTRLNSQVLSFTAPAQPHLEHLASRGEQVQVQVTVRSRSGQEGGWWHFSYTRHKPRPGQYGDMGCLYCSNIID